MKDETMGNILKTIDTMVTDKWGVQWDEMETVRDFLQNFYDANMINNIEILIDNSEVCVSAPAVFDYKELLYLGSDKGNDPDTIGQYGEGFKASLLNALRNWNCDVEFYVENKKLRYYFKNMDIGRSNKRVVFCELSEINPVKGSVLVVKNCSSRLIEEFKFGLNYFYYEHNPLFGEMLAGDYRNEIVVYKSTDPKCGYVFYKKLMRAKIELPIVIVCNKEYKNIGNKINHDRDRKAFNDEVLEALLRLVFRNFNHYTLGPMLLYVSDWWVKGDKLLSVIAETQRPRYGEKNYSNIFPETYYAKESIPTGIESVFMSTLIVDVVEEFKKLNYQCCPRYMSYFGMKTPDGVAENRLKDSQDKMNKIYTRDLTVLEKQGIDVLAGFIKKLSSELYEKFAWAKYTVGENDDIIGELKKKRNYREQHIFLNKIFFMFSFSDALAVLLHEWAHIYGHDGSRSFSDALTGFIAIILKNKDAINELRDFEREWETITAKVKDERGIEEAIVNFDEMFSHLSYEQLTELLKDIPQEELFKLLKRNKLL